jgi:hypothetical protein
MCLPVKNICSKLSFVKPRGEEAKMMGGVVDSAMGGVAEADRRFLGQIL